MFSDNGGANDSRKRKTEEVGESSNAAVPFRGQPHLPLHGVLHVPLVGSLETSRVQQALDMDMRPFSYQYLLMDAPDPEGYLSSLHLPGNRSMSQPIDQSSSQHGGILRNELSGMVTKTTEIADNKLKELQMELFKLSLTKGYLESKALDSRLEAEDLRNKVKSLKRTAGTLRKAVNKAYEKFMRVQDGLEDAESCYVDPTALGPVRLECIMCKRQMATVLMLMCQHLCVCTQCDHIIDACPVCEIPKVGSVEVLLPYDQK